MFLCVAADEEIVLKGVKDKLLAISPQMPIDAVSVSEVPWLFQISLKDGGILYADKSGDFLFAGQVFELREGRFNNLTEKSKKKNRVDLLSLSPESEMIIFLRKLQNLWPLLLFLPILIAAIAENCTGKSVC